MMLIRLLRSLPHWMLLLSLTLCARVWAASPIELKGDLTQGGLVVGQIAADAQVWYDDHKLELTKDGHFVFGFERDDDLNHSLKVRLADGQEWTQPVTISARDYDIQYIEGIPKKMMEPDPNDLKRIREENAQVARARGRDSRLNYFLEGFISPAKGPITGVYGSQRYFNGEPRRPHYGLDIAAPRGASVIAPASGEVTLTHPDMFFSGGTLVIDHGYGVSSTFIHLDKILVKVGDKVEQGQEIAKVGSTGRATGPHLDWRINWFQTRLDPALLLASEPKMMSNKNLQEK
ncbi:M23 family metallopeptidase [Hahella sp. KA22]|nr:M23 family metallopeptidase [Hahella sp. KA22]QAY54315.1 M23 family metallopeptidase [Hahella sp. KA22]